MLENWKEFGGITVLLKEKKLSFIFECDGNKVDLSSFDYGIISVDGIESTDFENYSSTNSFYDGCTIYKTRIKERYILNLTLIYRR